MKKGAWIFVACGLLRCWLLLALAFGCSCGRTIDRGPNCQQIMPHPEMKRQRLEEGHLCNDDDEAVADNNDLCHENNDFLVSIESLIVDVLANIFGFLLPVDIMNARVNRKMREAAKITIVPPTYELVVSQKFGKSFNAMRVMATALPNLQKIELGDLGDGNKYVDGEDPDEDLAARTAGDTAHDIEIISNFTKLRELKIHWSVPLNGRYPCFFDFLIFKN
jgi:hypothetical protein